LRGWLSSAAIAVLVLAACTQEGSAAALRSNPEAELAFPGSILIERTEHDARTTIDGPTSAAIRAVLASEKSTEDVEDFFATELGRLGWRDGTDRNAVGLGFATTAELRSRVWRKGDLVFRLGFVDPEDPRAPSKERTQGLPTIYNTGLFLRPEEA
jgi:hypothetical protein